MHAARKQGLTVKMIDDNLFINNQKFTVNNLHQLPPCIDLRSLNVREDKNHIFFFGEYCEWSNWSKSDFTVDNVSYINMEQFIMRNKADVFKDKVTADKIMASTSPSEMKFLGNHVAGFNENVWLEKVKDVALKGITAKFTQNESLKTSLLNTGQKVFVEASPRDKVWGIGRYLYDKDIFKDKERWGDNLLGETLMKVRTNLRA